MEEYSVKCCLEQNSNKAEAIIIQLSKHLHNIKQTMSLADEKIKLKTSNDELLLEVYMLKEKLMDIERKNCLNPTDINNITREAPPSKALQEHFQSKQTKEDKKDIPTSKSQEKDKTTEKYQDVIDINLIDLRVGKILNVKKHPDADSLYIEEIDIGESLPRIVVSGLVKHVSIEQINQRLVVVMCNLKPAKMRGILSQAMVMCASSPDKIELLDPPKQSLPGDRVILQGRQIPDHFPPQLNPKKKMWEKIQPDLQTDKDGIATYKGVPLRVSDRGVCKAPTMKNCTIK